MYFKIITYLKFDISYKYSTKLHFFGHGCPASAIICVLLLVAGEPALAVLSLVHTRHSHVCDSNTNEG